jgi:hypothetical protein
VDGLGAGPIELALLSRPECGLCDELRKHVDALLADRDRRWRVVNVDSDPALSEKWGESIPVLFVNGRLFAKIRLPKLAPRLRLLRAANRSKALRAERVP